MSEAIQHRIDRGLWAQSGVPKKGWTCVSVEDLEEPSATCEMCGTSEIRYVHYMTHRDYSGELAVGCVCAEHMEQDYKNPKLRERRLRNLARRRINWHKRKWKTSYEGNVHINVEGYHITVFKRRPSKKTEGNTFTVVIENTETGKHKYGQKNFSSIDDAKTAAFDALVWAKENLS